MKIFSHFIISGLFAMLLMTQGGFVHAIPDIANLGSASDKIPNQYIIVLKDGEPVNQVASEAKNKGAEVFHVYEKAINGFAVLVPNQHVLAAIQKDSRVAYIEQDQMVQAFGQTLPTGINRVDADLSTTASINGIENSLDVDIAIIDTGISKSHSDLFVYKDVTFVKGTKSGNDDNGHGSHVAGIAAAKDNSVGVVGIAPGARLWAVKVLDRNGSGSISNVISGVDYVTSNANQIDVANMSLGCECASSALNTAIHNSVLAGVTYVVAAGNSAKDASTFSPANHPDVIAVSAIADSDGKCGGAGSATTYGADDTFATFSNFGSVVDMAAPGVGILSTYKGTGYATLSGTSMASPHVVGAAALYKTTHPTASPSDVILALTSSGSTPATACDGNGSGYFGGDPDGIPEPLLYAKGL